MKTSVTMSHVQSRDAGRRYRDLLEIARLVSWQLKLGLPYQNLA